MVSRSNRVQKQTDSHIIPKLETRVRPPAGPQEGNMLKFIIGVIVGIVGTFVVIILTNDVVKE